jgi:hypothetical protein
MALMALWALVIVIGYAAACSLPYGGVLSKLLLSVFSMLLVGVITVTAGRLLSARKVVLARMNVLFWLFFLASQGVFALSIRLSDHVEPNWKYLLIIAPVFVIFGFRIYRQVQVLKKVQRNSRETDQ